MNCFDVEAARSFICVKIKVVDVLEQGTSYLIPCWVGKEVWGQC